MDQALRNYLETHRRKVNAAALQIASGLARPDDTDRDARQLVRDSRAALHTAIQAALAAGPLEGRRCGASGEVCVAIRVPYGGQATMGKIAVSAARLDPGAMIPCPEEWPQDRPLPSGLVERLHRMIFPEPESPRIAEADAGGRVELGERNANAAFVLTELPEGEVWLRPLEANTGDKL